MTRTARSISQPTGEGATAAFTRGCRKCIWIRPSPREIWRQVMGAHERAWEHMSTRDPDCIRVSIRAMECAQALPAPAYTTQRAWLSILGRPTTGRHVTSWAESLIPIQGGYEGPDGPEPWSCRK